MFRKIAVLTLLLICMSTLMVMAEGFDSTVTIEGSHIVKNNESLKTGRHTFVLTAKDNAPMPEGSSNGVKEVTVSSNESFSFGEMHYTKPGIYTYTVSRNLTKSKNLKEDNAVYTCNVAVFTDGTVTVVFSEEGVDGKPDRIEYTDRYIASKTKTKVQTGDNNLLFVYIGLFAIALSLMGLVYKRR